MSRVMCKSDESAKSDLVFAILAMNAFRKLMEDNPAPFREISFRHLFVAQSGIVRLSEFGKYVYSEEPYMYFIIDYIFPQLFI